MWQQRCHKLIREAHKTSAILHLGSLTELMEAGKIDGQPGVASMIRQAVARGKLLAIRPSARRSSYQLSSAKIQCSCALSLRWKSFEAEPAKLLEILTSAARERSERVTQQLQRTSGLTATDAVRFTAQAIEELHRLHARYATYSALPAQPLRLMQTMLEQIDRPVEFTAKDVAAAFSAQTGLPEFVVNDAVPIDLEAIEKQLISHVIGQAEPAELIVNLLATLKARMMRPGRPFASLLFIGPTGRWQNRNGEGDRETALLRYSADDSDRHERVFQSAFGNQVDWSTR